MHVKGPLRATDNLFPKLDEDVNLSSYAYDLSMIVLWIVLGLQKKCKKI